jgi:citrate synthase
MTEGPAGDAPITVAGHDVVELMRTRTLTETMLLALDGELPEPGRTRVVDAVLVSIMDHGITPSSLATRLVLDGAPESLSGAVAAGLLAVGSRFLGTIEDAARLLEAIVAAGGEPEEAAAAEVSRIADAGGRVPGLGHNLHAGGDPRVEVLLGIAREESIAGPHVAAYDMLPPVAERRLGRALVPNAAGAVGAVLCDLGYRAEDVRGFALVARAAGLFAQALDERRAPIARDVWQTLNRERSAAV